MYSNLNAIVSICNNAVSNKTKNTISIHDICNVVTLKGNSAKLSFCVQCVVDLNKYGDLVIEKDKEYAVELILEHIETKKYMSILKSKLVAQNNIHGIVEQNYIVSIKSLVFKPGEGDYRVSLLIKEKDDNSWVEQTSTILTVKFE